MPPVEDGHTTREGRRARSWHDATVRVLGIDLAAEAPTTGAILLEPDGPGRWRAREVVGPLDDDRLVQAAQDVDVVGVDAPLGWPVAFVEAVAAQNQFRPWPGANDRSTLTHRDTDRAIRQHGFGTPLSVSADRLGSVAMRGALLQRSWAESIWSGAAPRDGSGALVETYPAAALRAWSIEYGGYKDRRHPIAAADVRRGMIEAIAAAVGPWLDLDPIGSRCITSDHALDALVCALVAVASKTAATHQPPDDKRKTARVEGWIHVPSRPLSEIAPPSLPSVLRRERR